MKIDDLRERYASIARLNLLPEKFTATVESIEERKDAKYLSLIHISEPTRPY